MVHVRVTLWRNEVRLARVIGASAQRHEHRSRLYLCVEHEGVAGYGEVSPQPFALHGDPSVDEVVQELVDVVVPRLIEMQEREGEVASWTRIARIAGPRPASASAVALVEMAVLDRELRITGTNARDLWPRVYDTPVQTTVSALGRGTSWRVDPGAARVRVKCAPGALDALALERLGRLETPVLLDFNCSADDPEDVLSLVRQVARVVHVDAVEQPFGPGNVIDHALLAPRLDCGLSIDEGVRSIRDVEHLAQYRAATMICVKPARVGGLANARTIIARALELSLRVYLGGFFESRYARGVHRQLAEHSLAEASDLGAVELVDDRLEVVEAPHGFALAPSAEILAHSSVIAEWC